MFFHLIYPPTAKICEPPGGVAYLAGALKRHGVKCTVIDANLEALLWLGRSCHQSSDRSLPQPVSQLHTGNRVHFKTHLKPLSQSRRQSQFRLQSGLQGQDRWTGRAVTHFQRNLHDLKDPGLYKNRERYRQRVLDVNRAISSALPQRFRITLADYHDSKLVPVKSRDLILSFENFRENPFYNYFENCLIEKIAVSGEINGQRSDYIGISLCYLSQALTGFALAGWIKSRFPGTKIIMGGGLVTSWMSFPDWKNPFDSIIDLMVKGQGQKVLLGIAGKDIRTGEHLLPDFDFASWDSYLAPGRILPYRTSTGCYWNQCRFCPERAEKSRYESEKAVDVLEDLEILSRRYRPDAVHFLDNSISPSLLKAVSKRKMPFIWYGFVRFIKELADPGFTKALYRSGCRMLKLGLESGDQDVLDYMHKGTELTMVSSILKALNQAGIATYVYILFGTLRETEFSAGRTLSYVADHGDEISFINTAIFNLPRFSEDADLLQTDSFYDGDLSLYLNFMHPEGWNRKNIRHFLSKKFKKNPRISPAIRNVPPSFTSNHAIFTASI